MCNQECRQVVASRCLAQIIARGISRNYFSRWLYPWASMKMFWFFLANIYFNQVCYKSIMKNLQQLLLVIFCYIEGGTCPYATHVPTALPWTSKCKLLTNKISKKEKCNKCEIFFKTKNFLQWRNFNYRTFNGPIPLFLVTLYRVYEGKCDQKVEYGTIKSLIVRICQKVFRHISNALDF